MKKVILFFMAVFALSACGSRQVKILDGQWTSMKQMNPPDASMTLVSVGAVESEFCMNAWSGSFGLMDEAVKGVEAKYSVDYIKNPSFLQTIGRPCVVVSGEGYRIKR